MNQEFQNRQRGAAQSQQFQNFQRSGDRGGGRFSVVVGPAVGAGRRRGPVRRRSATIAFALKERIRASNEF